MKNQVEYYLRLGLIGYPLGHSLSPILHRAALKANGIKGEYRLYPIENSSNGVRKITKLCERVRNREIKGLNVTIPYKQMICGFVDILTTTAAAVGAVNTIYLDNSTRLVGDNTDVSGFSLDVVRLTGDEIGTAIVLGAGGSARAIAYALCLKGWNVLILARRLEQAEKLVAEINEATGLDMKISCESFQRQVLNDYSLDCRLIVNTTPLGMYPNVDGSPWPDDIPFPTKVKIYDLIYNPIETKLLRRAKAEGFHCSNGSGMLVAQAAFAFARWTGLEPPLETMAHAFPLKF